MVKKALGCERNPISFLRKKASEAYEKVNDTLELNKDPYNKKLRKAKELKGKLGDSISKVGKYVSEKSAKFLGKNQYNKIKNKEN